jgi:hypothetical protein
MLRTEPASPAELAQLHRETRIENRAYARAQDRAAADPCKTYRCCECGETSTASEYHRDGECTWMTAEATVCRGRLIGQPVVQLRNPVTGNTSVTLKAGAA